MNISIERFKESQDAVRKYADEVRELESKLEKAENLLKEIKTTDSHYQIIHSINEFFDEEGEIV